MILCISPSNVYTKSNGPCCLRHHQQRRHTDMECSDSPLMYCYNQVYEDGSLIGTPTGTSLAVTGLSPSTSYSFSVDAVDSFGRSSSSSALLVKTGSSSGSGGTATSSSGTIGFHLLLGHGSAADSITLTGGNYDDLIMSNMIAGVLYGHLVRESYPGVQFSDDYLYGSIFGQLLQENIAILLGAA